MADDNVLTFRPRPGGGLPPMPPLLPLTPGGGGDGDGPHQPGDGDGDGGDGVPRLALPGVEEMRPPRPGVPLPALPGDGEEGEIDFVPPAPADPDRPTLREAAVVAMALMTALGTAAAKALWARARHRQALADKEQAAAGKARAAAARRTGGTGGHSRKTSGGVSALRSHGGGHSPRGGDRSRRGGHRSHDRRSGDRPAARSHDRRGDAHRSRDRRRSDRRPNDHHGDAHRSRDRYRATRHGQAVTTALRKTGRGIGATARTARKAARTARPAIGRGVRLGRLVWQASTGAGRAAANRWRTAAGGAAGKRAPRAAPRRASGGYRYAGAWRAGRGRNRWWRIRDRKATGAAKTRATGKGSSWHDEPRRGWQDRRAEWSWAPPPPPPGAEWMRPPPGADRSTYITVERVGDPEDPPRPAAAPLTTTARHAAPGMALPPAPARTNGNPMTTLATLPEPAHTAQDDAELTIHDLLDYTTDKVTEIKAGVTYAHRIAQGCEELIKHLEELHAQILKLQVPGSLPGDLRDLMEQTGSVRAYAKTLAERLRAAAERLQSAGAKAKEQHMPLADAVRDMGHDRPAEREYHDE